MAKTNSLKIVPYAKHEIFDIVYDESHPGAGLTWGDPLYKSYLDTGQRVVIWAGEKVLEYTQGSPGSQTDAGSWKTPNPIDWRPNDPFDAVLTVRSLETGRSAVRFWLEDEASKTYYPMFGQTLVDVLADSTYLSLGGKIGGTWIIVKKGSNYGVEFYTP